METGCKGDTGGFITGPPDSGKSPPGVEIHEAVDASAADGTHAALYAYFDKEQVAALDFTRSRDSISINMVYVKPQFRRCGIGSALVRHLLGRYPAVKIDCGGAAMRVPFLVHALNTVSPHSCPQRD
ncbi:MAG TPA: GNAT family N-acetyltransferase [Noviherbaspirillum sp.]|nr:GNAT family N-acetyltransferase [Noviherbaspirillum sp.]